MIVDDHPIVRRGLAHLINQQKDLDVCREAEDVEGALAHAANTRLDLAIVDLALRDSSGIDLVKQLKKLHPDLAVLVVSMYDEQVYAERVLRAGARGYVTKHEVAETIIEAVRSVLAGDVYLSEAMSKLMLQDIAEDRAGLSPLQALSDRELEVFRMLGRGIKTREIADALRLSVKTVETYRARMREKLRLRPSANLVEFAVQWHVDHPSS